MKVYQDISHIKFEGTIETSNKLEKSIAKEIIKNLDKGLQSEVQYSTCATHNTIVYSALILGYTEE